MKYDIEINQRTGEIISGKWLNKIVEQTLRAIGVESAQVSVAFVGKAEMTNLNKTWRGKNCVTDVLSFDFRVLPRHHQRFSASTINGEIIICYQVAEKQAREQGHDTEEEIKILLVHGLLHLAGYDHERSLGEAKRMEKLQNKLLHC